MKWKFTPKYGFLKRSYKNGNGRLLKLTKAGQWYIGLTIVLGVGAIGAGNNILYLLESFLLGGMILSGILSERVVSETFIKWKRGNAIAGVGARDQIKIENRGRIPLFCIEVGEIINHKYVSRAFFPYVPPNGTATSTLDLIYKTPGKLEWTGIACASAYPFGFAKKVRWYRSPGSRLIWPGKTEVEEILLDRGGIKTKGKYEDGIGSNNTRGRRGNSGDIVPGEVRQWTPGEGLRDIVWTLADKGEDPFVRVRTEGGGHIEFFLDIKEKSQESIEKEIAEISSRIYELCGYELNGKTFSFRNPNAAISLKLNTVDRLFRIEGMAPILDRLTSLMKDRAA